MKCVNCLYYYKAEDNTFPVCQWYSRAPGECALAKKKIIWKKII